jgi:MFS family permease
VNGLRATFRSLSVRNYRLYFGGHAISEVGTWMQKVGQAWLVLELTGSGTLLGVTFAIQHLPILVIGPWGGLLADRLNKRRLLTVTNGVAGLLALVLGTLTATGLVELWMVLALALGLGVTNALEKPARHTFVIEMVGPSHLTNAITLNSVVTNTGKVVGPSLAGILIATIGLASSFLVNAASYLAVVTALALMRRRELTPVDPMRRARGQLREGFGYVLRTPGLLGPLVLMTVAGMLAYEWSVTLPLLARDAFDGDARVFGMMFSAMGVGAVVGGLAVAGRLAPSARQLLKLAGVFGVLIVVLACAPTLQVALGLLIGVGAASIAFRSVAMSWIQLESSPQMRGRVMSLLVVATAGTTPIGAPLVGWLAELYGARVAVGLGGVGTVLAGSLVLLYLRRRNALDPSRQSPVAVTKSQQPV